MVNFCHCNSRNLKHQGKAEVHDCTNGSEVVQRYQGIHFILRGVQQTLHHHKPDSLEKDATELEDKSNEDKLDLPDRCNDDTDDDERYI